jgi:hypothetical protein
MKLNWKDFKKKGTIYAPEHNQKTQNVSTYIRNSFWVSGSFG